METFEGILFGFFDALSFTFRSLRGFWPLSIRSSLSVSLRASAELGAKNLSAQWDFMANVQRTTNHRSAA